MMVGARSSVVFFDASHSLPVLHHLLTVWFLIDGLIIYLLQTLDSY